jgi:phosphate transport system substrate-binding protein
MKNKFMFYVFAFLIFISCETKNKNTDTPTTGHVWIAADESLRPLIEVEERVFESIYPEAHLDFIYASEQDVVKLMLSDSVKLCILTRHLSDKEKSHFDEIKITPRYSPFAKDAIAFILNNKTTDTTFTLLQLSKILDGTYSSWQEINPKAEDKDVQIVFDNAGSGAVRYLKDSLLNGKELGKQCYAVANNPAVIARVENDPHSIGIIGMAWISDVDDSISHAFLKRIKVANLVPKDLMNAQSETMKPYQAFVALKQYPFWRNIEMVNCSGKTGLGTGFAAFIASDNGQRIVLKAGMVPATTPVRIINLNSK